jgi:hypothetical protein
MATGPCRAGFAETHCYIYLGAGGGSVKYYETIFNESETNMSAGRSVHQVPQQIKRNHPCQNALRTEPPSFFKSPVYFHSESDASMVALR